MIDIYKNLYLGDIDDMHAIGLENDSWAFVHATQTVHFNIFGWDKNYNQPEKSHDSYLYYEEDNILSLNWVDGPAVLYESGGVESFNKALDFIDEWIDKRKVLVHCDQGVSRSPTLVLTYLAKRTGEIPGDSFELAKNNFVKIYPDYFPGGIEDYVSEHWSEIE